MGAFHLSLFHLPLIQHASAAVDKCQTRYHQVVHPGSRWGVKPLKLQFHSGIFPRIHPDGTVPNHPHYRGEWVQPSQNQSSVPFQCRLSLAPPPPWAQALPQGLGWQLVKMEGREVRNISGVSALTFANTCKLLMAKPFLFLPETSVPQSFSLTTTDCVPSQVVVWSAAGAKSGVMRPANIRHFSGRTTRSKAGEAVSDLTDFLGLTNL